MCSCILHIICRIQNEDIDDYMEPPEFSQPQIPQLPVQEYETEGIRYHTQDSHTFIC